MTSILFFHAFSNCFIELIYLYLNCSVFPKTDYTYAKSSQCRYEIAPGILAMPNMSRRSIHSNDSDTNNTQTQSENSCLTLSRTFDSGLDTTNNKPYKDALNQIKTVSFLYMI